MAKVKKPSSPDYLTMRLFGPGMGLLHRAGLGGLACTLRMLERQNADGLLAKAKLPAPIENDSPPWDITDDTITLRFGKPEKAEEYLRKLFAFAFTVRKDGLIYLPGQFNNEPSTAILADLQLGQTLTFLQHGKVRQLAKEPTTVSYDPEGEGVPGVEVTYRRCSGFKKHQEGWKELVDSNGCLTTGPIRVDGPISPGSVVRHVAFTSSTAAEDPPERMLPLYFSLVGCLPLPVNRGVAALLVPDVGNLLEFVWDRPAMTPTTAAQAQIANAADGALQSQWRLRSNPVRAARIGSKSRNLAVGAIPGIYAMTFTPTPWASQQKSRVATIHVPKGDDKLLDRFDRALSYLPTRIVPRTVRQATGRGKQKVITERKESFRSESVVRPLVAENLALGRRWYAGFIKLATKINPATDKPYRNQLPFERKGLHSMISDPKMWDEAGESIVVQAVHSALRGRYAQIADENKTNSTAMRNRFSGEYDRWRLAFAGSKTADQFRTSLCDLFSRAGRNEVLQQQWRQILPMLRAASWQHARDLALLALCSYQGRGAEADPEQPQAK